MKLIKYVSTLILLLLATVANAKVWEIVPANSHLQFSATQNNSPVTGEFKHFSGDIKFDPAQLAQSSVNIIVDVNSVTTSYAQVADTLKTSDWFDVKLFPNAVFAANKFVKTGDKTYEADGTLTIRGKATPVKLAFSLDEYTYTHAKVTGSTHLKRSILGVGIGEWASTDSVKDDIKVNFLLEAVSK